MYRGVWFNVALRRGGRKTWMWKIDGRVGGDDDGGGDDGDDDNSRTNPTVMNDRY